MFTIGQEGINYDLSSIEEIAKLRLPAHEI